MIGSGYKAYKFVKILPPDLFVNFIEVSEWFVPVLGAGHGLDHLVHARHVAAPLVAALVHTGRHAPLPRVQAGDTPQHLKM